MLGLIRALFYTKEQKYSWEKTTCVISLSITVVLALSLGSLVVYKRIQTFQINQKGYLQAIVQTGSQSGTLNGIPFASLPTGLLAEVLDLSADCPVYFNQFDLKMARFRLLATHAIENVKLKKTKPNLLFIEYTLREPWAYLEDYTNTGIDTGGVFFPLSPFYSPRHLPGIFLGEASPAYDPWGEQMRDKLLNLAKTLTRVVKEEIEMIDLSQVYSTSAGRREIVITLKEGIILRLTPKNCVQQLTHYSILKSTLLDREGQKQKMIIDLRIPEVAYLQRMADVT